MSAAAIAAPLGAAPPLEDRILRDRRRETLRLLLVASPAVLVVLLLLVIPVGWLFALSVYGEQGLTTAHYARIFADPTYRDSLWLTLHLSLIVTAACVLVGYPLAYLIAGLRPLWAGLCLSLVIIPFWTSLLVRTYAWLVLLQRRGVINNTLVGLGVIDEPLYLVHNPTGAAIGMFHIMLPFFVLPLYASLKRIDPELMRAASALGAGPMRAFWKVYFPLSMPGLFAGGVLVLVLCLGFYITPALLGGGRTLMIAMLIERNVNLFFEWGAASSVAVVFLVAVLAAFALVSRFLPLRTMFGGAG